MRTTLLAAFLFLAAARSAHAQDKAKPNTLTPKEIADGWILLFDGETTFGWKTEGDVKIKEGSLVLTGGESGATLTSTLTLASYEVLLESVEGSSSGWFVLKNGSSDAGI